MNTQLQTIIDTCTAIDGVLTDNDATITAQKTQIDTLTQAHASDVQNMQVLSDQHAADVKQIQTLTAQVASAPSPDAALLDVVTSRRKMTVFAGLHKLPAKTTDAGEVPGVWIDSGGHTAQSNPGTSTTPHGVFTWTPGTDSTPARIVFDPAAGWDDIFIYEKFPLPIALPRFVSDVRAFSLSPADRAAVNCIEWQQEYTWKGKVYNLGWQWNFSSKLFRYFNFNTKVWVPCPNVPFLDLGATPVTVMTEHVLDEAKGTTTHVALNVNGVRYPMNVTQPATPTANGNKYTISLLQMDANSKGTPFGVNIHNAEARYL